MQCLPIRKVSGTSVTPHSSAETPDIRKTNWTTAEIVIEFFNPDEKTAAKRKPPNPSRKNARYSRRLRRLKQHGERRRITVSKDTTVKEIKIKVCDPSYRSGVAN